LEEASASDEKDSEKDKFLRVANFFGKEEEETACDEDNGKKIGAEAKEEEEDSAEVGAGGTDEISFWALGGLGVEREIAWIKGEEGKKHKNTCTENGEGDDFLTEGRSGAVRFRFGHGMG
jgi:hypothetical protein